MVVLKDKNGKELTREEVFQKSTNRLNSIILDFKLMVIRLFGHIPFHSLRLVLYATAGIKLGTGARIHMWFNCFNPRNISIGEDSIIGDHAFLDGRAKLVIGNHVDIASYVLIYNSQHDIDSEDFHAVSKNVEIGDFVFIGPRVTILPGVKIGKGAVVAAGAVVTKDIKPFSIVGGIPAEVIGERTIKNPHYRLGRARLFQ